MIDQLIYALIILVVVGLIIWLAYWVLQQVGLPEPFAKIAYVILAVLAFLVVLYYVLLPLLHAARP